MPANQPVVLLRERDGSRCVPIWIGAAEATAIAYAQQGVTPPRPLTHDLLVEVVEALGTALTEVRIVALVDKVFFAELELASGAVVSARPSDAIALALRAPCPVLVDDAVMDEAGVEMADTEADDPDGNADAAGVADTANMVNMVNEDDEVERFRAFLDNVSAEDFESPPDGEDQANP